MTERRPLVLVVEDDPDFGLALRDMIHSLGYGCELARDGYAGLLQAVKLVPDVVLADVLLPRLNGFAVCQRIKAHEDLREVPVVLMSSVYRNREQLKRDMPVYGADAYIAKPFGLPVVERILAKVLGRAAALEPGPPLQPATAPPVPRPTVAAPPAPEEEARTRTGDVALAGRLPTPPFHEVLYTVFRRGLSGVLEVRWEGAWKRIYFLNGVVVSADSNSTNETLGALLLEENRVSEEEVERALAIMQQERCQLGEALVRVGAISATERHEALRLQLRERVLKCFRFQRGTFSFTADGTVGGDRLTYEENPVGLVFDGVRQYGDVNDIAARLGQHLEQYPMRTDRYAAYLPFLKGRSEGWDDVLAALDGARDLGQLVGLGHVDIHDLLKGVWALSELEMVEFRDRPRTDSLPIVPTVANLGLGEGEEVASEAPEVRATAERILRDAMRLEGAGPRTVLGIARDADALTAEYAAEVRRAAYHPDNLPEGLSGGVRERAKQLYHLVNRSLEALRRAEEGEATSDEAPCDAEAEARNVRASRAVAQGKKALRRRDHVAALAAFRAALEQAPGSAEAHALAGWCLVHQVGGDVGERVAEAESMVREAIRLHTDLADAHFYLALMLKETGRLDEASDHLAAAVRCDPEHREARWHLQLVDLRVAASGGERSTSRWDRVFEGD